jgi:UDP-N-acetylglucosamine--N-acetylmuramyl-(pentapeptide) pyrophosphoryl-undecaprenol N-acetylglucosamine transferase
MSGEPKDYKDNPYRFLIAGGGTGGHLFPGIAIAQEVMARNHRNKVLFVSSGKPFEKEALSKAGFRHISISAGGIKRLKIKDQITSAIKIPKGIFQSMVILKRFKPNIVIGVGSYSAGPVVMGAWLMRIIVVLQEQNTIPGITNRILANFAKRIYISFEVSKKHIAPKKVIFTGNPVRKEFFEHMTLNNNNSRPYYKQNTFTLLIVGGSQGAHALNTAITESLQHLKDIQSYFFIHQTGPQDEDIVKNAYHSSGCSCEVKAFYDDMARQYNRADLVICRAGATTVAEVTAMGKSAIFIPYPFAADNHQTINANALANMGAAEMIHEKDLCVKLLARRIEYYASHRDALKKMAEKAKQIGRPKAASTIVNDCFRLLNN